MEILRKDTLIHLKLNNKYSDWFGGIRKSMSGTEYVHYSLNIKLFLLFNYYLFFEFLLNSCLAPEYIH